MKHPTKLQPTSSLTRRRSLTTMGGLAGVSTLAACMPGEQRVTSEEARMDATADKVTTTDEATDVAIAEMYQAPGFLSYALAPAMLEVVQDRNNILPVRHQMGETAIPKNLQPISADTSTLDILLTLGVDPVAANSSFLTVASLFWAGILLTKIPGPLC
ncbi:MAG: hypothetical protein MI924_33265 [Chloroflexales bacterium]|nr:hypothetical protein [Chloroflexales bacterium]